MCVCLCESDCIYVRPCVCLFVYVCVCAFVCTSVSVCLFELLFEWLLLQWLLLYPGVLLYTSVVCLHAIRLHVITNLRSYNSATKQIISIYRRKCGPENLPAYNNNIKRGRSAIIIIQSGCLFCYDVIREKKMDITLVMNVFVWNEYLSSSI